MNITVLAGGTSSERDVSLVTGTQVANALNRKGHKAVLVDVFMGFKDEMTPCERFENAGETVAAAISSHSPDIETVKKERGESADGFFGNGVLAQCKASDIVFMGLHGEDGEDGKIQAAFDLLGIKYTGSGYLGSALAMNKDFAKNVFRAEGVPTPKGCAFSKGEEGGKVPFPCVVKPASGGSSVGVTIAHNEEEYKEALEAAFEWSERVVVEEYISGREFSVGVIDGKACPIIEIAPIAGFYDYKNKYQAGATVDTCPAVLDTTTTLKMQKAAEKAYKVLKLSAYARMDFLMNEEGEIFCLEANTLPGMTPTSLLPQEAAADGVNFDDLCDRLVNISLDKYNRG